MARVSVHAKPSTAALAFFGCSRELTRAGRPEELDALEVEHEPDDARREQLTHHLPKRGCGVGVDLAAHRNLVWRATGGRPASRRPDATLEASPVLPGRRDGLCHRQESPHH